MKTCLSLVILLFISFVTFAQQKPQINLGIIFRVQVAASTTPLPKTSKLFKDIADLEGVTFPDGYIRYMTGTFESLYAAQQHQEEIKVLGYKDAYVTALQGKKRLTPDQAITLIYDAK